MQSTKELYSPLQVRSCLQHEYLLPAYHRSTKLRRHWHSNWEVFHILSCMQPGYNCKTTFRGCLFKPPLLLLLFTQPNPLSNFRPSLALPFRPEEDVSRRTRKPFQAGFRHVSVVVSIDPTHGHRLCAPVVLWLPRGVATSPFTPGHVAKPSFRGIFCRCHHVSWDWIGKINGRMDLQRPGASTRLPGFLDGPNRAGTRHWGRVERSCGPRTVREAASVPHRTPHPRGLSDLLSTMIRLHPAPNGKMIDSDPKSGEHPSTTFRAPKLAATRGSNSSAMIDAIRSYRGTVRTRDSLHRNDIRRGDRQRPHERCWLVRAPQIQYPPFSLPLSVSGADLVRRRGAFQVVNSGGSPSVGLSRRFLLTPEFTSLSKPNGPGLFPKLNRGIARSNDTLADSFTTTSSKHEALRRSKEPRASPHACQDGQVSRGSRASDGGGRLLRGRLGRRAGNGRISSDHGVGTQLSWDGRARTTAEGGREQGRETAYEA